mgnify:CR=1 FL=1
MEITEKKISIIGLGYVGLPLAVEFGKRTKTIGYDINEQRINNLKLNQDSTNEVGSADIKSAKKLIFSNNAEDIRDSDIYIITVPTPIDENKHPDLSLVKSASKTVGSIIKKGDLVIYESTVYPGATEEICIPILEASSNLTINEDFLVGYSPERINPGDKNHRIINIVKVTSGSNDQAAKYVDHLYQSIIPVGTHMVSSIRIAETAKVIENTQRDLNIALMNELSIICKKMGLDTTDVIEAAATKWNFSNFKPGLVGGHCIGVDPYYLTYKANKIGHNPKVILSGRSINDEMGDLVGQQIIDHLENKGKAAKDSQIIILGLTFKQNVPDLRNSKVLDVYRFLDQKKCNIQIHDSLADTDEVKKLYKMDMTVYDALAPSDLVLLAVAHQEYIDGGWEAMKMLVNNKNGIVFDVMSKLPRKDKPEEIELIRL